MDWDKNQCSKMQTTLSIIYLPVAFLFFVVGIICMTAITFPLCPMWLNLWEPLIKQKKRKRFLRQEYSAQRSRTFSYVLNFVTRGKVKMKTKLKFVSIKALLEKVKMP